MTTHTTETVLAEFPSTLRTESEIRMAAALAEARNERDTLHTLYEESKGWQRVADELRQELARVRPIVELFNEFITRALAHADSAPDAVMVSRDLLRDIQHQIDAVRAADATTEPKERTDAK